MSVRLNLRNTIDYPTSDGKPMAETDIHYLEMVALRLLLDQIFESQNDVYVASNNFVYYQEGNPKACFSPDVYVVCGVPKMLRDCYMTWKEGGIAPSAVFEFTSKSTKREDLQTKKELCESLGVKEYFLFDPKSEYLKPPLQGYRLERGHYIALEPDKTGFLFSEVLNHKLCVNDTRRLTLIDPKNGAPLIRVTEQARHEAERARQEAERANREAEARRAAESELVRLKEELKRLKNQG